MTFILQDENKPDDDVTPNLGPTDHCEAQPTSAHNPSEPIFTISNDTTAPTSVVSEPPPYEVSMYHLRIE